jgi:hypothetical protein
MTHRPDPILAIAVAVVFFVVVHMVYGWRECWNCEEGFSYHDCGEAKRCTCKQHRIDGRQATEPDCPIHSDRSAWCSACGCGCNAPDGSVIFAHLDGCSQSDAAAKSGSSNSGEVKS